MLKTTSKHLRNFIKVATITYLAAFLMPSCAIVSSYNSNQSSAPRILSSHQTHALLSKWSANDYQSLSGHTITYQSHHPMVKNNQFAEIKSGYKISPLTKRTKGIGLAAVIKTKSAKNPGSSFTPITPDAYLTNLHPANLVATQKKTNGKLSTHIDIYDPRSNRHQNQPLAHQPRIVIDYINAIPGNSTLKFMGLFRPQQYDTFQGFYLAEPYDRDRIPILMIHGLASSPETFMDMAEAINADAQLRKKYQLWYYFYPSGNPWIASASEFRKSYRTLIQKLDPNRNDSNIRKTVLIAHSMGGLIARASISIPGETLHEAYWGNASVSKFLNDQEHEKIKDYFHYKPLQEPAKIIYMATPHRGSKIADSFIGWVTIKIISIPSFIVQQTADVLTLKYPRGLLPEQAIKLLTVGESSVEQLKPSNPSLKALNRMPLRKNRQITSHSIIGDVGLPLFQLQTDGVVSYLSAHIPNSKSESIVPSSHKICDNEEAIQAVLRILKQ